MPTDIDQTAKEATAGDSGASGAPSSPPPTTAAAAPPAAAADATGAVPGATVTTSNAPQPGFAKKAYQTVLNVLGGGTPTRPVVDPQTGKISDQPIPRGEAGNRPGDWARHILAAALTGMGGGANAPRRPGAEAVSGLGAGAEAEMNREQAIRGRQVGEAQQGFANQQKLTQEKREAGAAEDTHQLVQAQIAHYTMENTAQTWELGQKKIQANAEQVAAFNTFGKETDVPGAVSMGEFANMEQVLEYEKAHPELVDHLGNGRLVARTVLDDKGNVQGIRAVYVPDELQRQPLSAVFSGKDIPQVKQFVPGEMVKGKMGPPKVVYHDADPRTPYGDFLNANSAADDKMQKWMLGQAELEEKKATTEKEVVATEQIRQQMHLQGLAVGADPFGNPITLPPGKNATETFNKRYDAFTKAEVAPLEKLEKTFLQFQGILSDVAAGKELTGAQSVIGLFNAIGISAEPLAGKGFRINSNTIEEHREALGMGDKAYRFFQGLKTGAVVTPQQLRDYASEAIRARNNAYREAAGSALRQHLPIDFLPKGFNKPVDGDTLQLYLDIAGGDRQKAANALARDGWAPPAGK